MGATVVTDGTLVFTVLSVRLACGRRGLCVPAVRLQVLLVRRVGLRGRGRDRDARGKAHARAPASADRGLGHRVAAAWVGVRAAFGDGQLWARSSF